MISANAVLFRPERGLPRDVRFAASRSLYEAAGRVGLRHEDEGIVRGDVIIRPNDRLTVGTEADFRGAVRRCSTAGRRAWCWSLPAYLRSTHAACVRWSNTISRPAAQRALYFSIWTCRWTAVARALLGDIHSARCEWHARQAHPGVHLSFPSCIVKFASWRFRTQVNASWC